MDAFHMNFFELDILTANIFTKFFGLKHYYHAKPRYLIPAKQKLQATLYPQIM